MTQQQFDALVDLIEAINRFSHTPWPGRNCVIKTRQDALDTARALLTEGGPITVDKLSANFARNPQTREESRE